MQTEPSRIIDALGGTAATARLCEVNSAAVSQWRENGIPKARMKFLKLARPDVFSNETGNPVPPEQERRTSEGRRAVDRKEVA